MHPIPRWSYTRTNATHILYYAESALRFVTHHENLGTDDNYERLRSVTFIRSNERARERAPRVSGRDTEMPLG